MWFKLIFLIGIAAPIHMTYGFEMPRQEYNDAASQLKKQMCSQIGMPSEERYYAYVNQYVDQVRESLELLKYGL